jgi:Tol biopolymer transport system component
VQEAFFMTIHRSLRILLFILVSAPTPLAAQYFGRNKVQYERFDFEIIKTEHFDVHYYPAEADATGDAARMAERWYERFSQLFRHEFPKRKPLVFYADRPDFQQTNTTQGLISQATGGFTEGLKNRVVMPFPETYAQTDHVLGHELVHAFQYDLARDQAAAGGGTGFFRLPLWVVEGLAEYLSIGRHDTHTAMYLRDALERDELPDLDDLTNDPKYFPYRFGHAFWAYVGGRWSDSMVAVLYEVATDRGMSPAIRQVLSVDPDSLAANWKQSIEEKYQPLLAGRTPPAQAGTPILGGDEEDEWSLAPVISPDGTKVVFLSQLELFTIDLFVADARTGQILGKLTSSIRSPHFDALSFLNSAGSWSPNGDRFAFVTFSEGDNEIAIAEVADRKVVKTLHLGEVTAVHDVAWSPDGRTIAVSGMKGGITDLFTVDLESERVEQLTRDRFAELHPSWSPDGRTIAFATDRGSAGDLDLLDLPPMGLGFFDLSSGALRVERPFEGAKHINPQYAPDGESVYFISDRGGFSDIYRLDLATNEAYQVTRVTTGVSGITELSPALSVSRGSGRLMFSVFEDSNYLGFALEPGQAIGEPVDRSVTPLASAADLPPGPVNEDRVASYLGGPSRGLPRDQSFPASDYDPDLSLDFVAPPTAGVAVDRFGGGLGGSVGFFFSDMLGDKQMGIAAVANGGAKDVGGEIAFANLGARTNWGARGGRIPYRSVVAQTDVVPVDGQLVPVVDLILRRVYQTGAEFAAEYPFSQTRRIEGAAGFTRYDFDFDLFRTFFVGNVPAGTEERDLDELEPDPINLLTGSVALVDDYSFFGFTSPVQGGRARFEVGGNFGSLDFGTVLADWRRYLFWRPVTLALRGLHYGRYGPDAEDEDALIPLFLGYESWVRGYESGSFEGTECTVVDPGDEDGSCPEFDRLIGSRIGIVNAELRMPLFGAEEFGLLGKGFLPTELALWGDGGIAWTSDESPKFKFERRSVERIPVFSVGASLRVNLFGALVGEFYYAYPLQRPEHGGHFGFQIAPGW